MSREELAERLQKHEWSDIEFKQACGGVPQDAYETVLAFAGTAGGWLVIEVCDAGVWKMPWSTGSLSFESSSKQRIVIRIADSRVPEGLRAVSL